jgi:hypothetical protein
MLERIIKPRSWKNQTLPSDTSRYLHSDEEGLETYLPLGGDGTHTLLLDDDDSCYVIHTNLVNVRRLFPCTYSMKAHRKPHHTLPAPLHPSRPISSSLPKDSTQQ